MVAEGREQRRQSQKGKSHAPDLSDWYRYHLPPISPGDYTFDLMLEREREPGIPLRLTQSLSWSDLQNSLSGSITESLPDPNDPSTLPVTRGQLVRCNTTWDGKTYELFLMRTQSPQTQIDQGTITLTLQDDLALLQAGQEDWYFRTTKARPYGYFCNEIAAAVGKRLGIQTGQLAQGTKRLNIVMRQASGYAVIMKAYQEEHNASHRSFIVRIRNGLLEVVTPQRNALLYVLRDQIQTALLSAKTGTATPTTALTGTATIGTGKSAKKISFTALDRSVIARLGYIHKTKAFGQVKSMAELQDKVNRELAKGLRTNESISIQHAGIPFIHRGDGEEIELPAWGYKGAQAFVYCTGATHAVQGGSYISTFDFIARDPYRSLWSAENKAIAARADKRQKRHRDKLHG